MNRPSTDQSSTTTPPPSNQKTGSTSNAGALSWLLKSAVVLVLALIWMVLLASPALGSWP